MTEVESVRVEMRVDDVEYRLKRVPWSILEEVALEVLQKSPREVQAVLVRLYDEALVKRNHPSRP